MQSVGLHMSRKLLLGVLVSAALGICLVIVAVGKPSNRAEKRLLVSENEIDLGLVRPGEYVESEIQISNLGSSPVMVLNVTKGCNCTRITVGESELLPGKSTSMRFGVTGTVAPKSISTIIIRTDDTFNPETTVNVHFRSRDGIWASPEKLSFGHLDLERDDLTSISQKCLIQGQSHICSQDLNVKPDEAFKLAFNYCIEKSLDKGGQLSASPQFNNFLGLVRGQLKITDSAGNAAVVNAEALVTSDGKLSGIQPLILRRTGVGTYEGQIMLKLSDNFRASYVGSKILGFPSLDCWVNQNDDAISIDCSSDCLPNKLQPISFVLEVHLPTGEKYDIWIPVAFLEDH